MKFALLFLYFVNCTYLGYTGGARNLKLGGNGGSKSQGTGGNKFFRMWAKCQPYFSCSVHQKDAAGFRGRAPGQEVRGQRSLKLKHFLL